MRIHAWPSDNAGCRWYRIHLPLKTLASKGMLAYTEGTSKGRYDILLGQRVCGLPQTILWQQIAAEPKSRRPRLVYELDDDVWSIPDDNPASRAYSASTTRSNIENNIRVADLVTVSTQPLAEVVKKFNKNVVVLPNMIERAIIDETHRWRIADNKYWHIVWSGSPTHRNDLLECVDGVRRAIRDGNRRLTLVGTDYRELFASDARPFIRVRPWVESIPQYYRMLRKFRCGLAPLKDTTFNQSKSDIRILELQALGVPAVASPVGPYAETRHVWRAATPPAWSAALRVLQGDPVEWTERRAAGLEAAAARTIEGNCSMWLEAYQSVL